MVIESAPIPNERSSFVIQKEISTNKANNILLSLERSIENLQLTRRGKPLKEHQYKKVFTLLKFRFTRYGATLQDVVQLPLPNENEASPRIVLTDPSAYDIFKPLFDLVLEQRHIGFKSTDVQPPVTWGDWDRISPLDPEGKHIQSITVSVSRNFHNIRFPPTVTPMELGEVEETVVAALRNLPVEFAGEYVSLYRITAQQTEELTRAGCLFASSDAAPGPGREPRFWPVNRGVYATISRDLAVWVNAKDHVRVLSLERGPDLQAAYRRLAIAAMELDEASLEPWACDRRVGHLTVDPDDVGAALRVEARVRLPRNLHADVTRVAAECRLDARLLDHDEGVFLLSARSCLGSTEFDTVMRFHQSVQKVLAVANKDDTTDDPTCQDKAKDEVTTDEQDDSQWDEIERVLPLAFIKRRSKAQAQVNAR